MITYLKKIAFPLLVEIIFVISCFIVPKEYFIYTNFVFYLTLFTYFIITKEFSFNEWMKNLKSGKDYWKKVLLTALFFALAFLVTGILEMIFPMWSTGDIILRVDSWHKLLIFALSTIMLPPITEEIFYRKNMIAFGNKKIIVITTVISMFFYALEHSLNVWGIVLAMIWAIPCSISYIKTKNVYIVISAHFLVNLIFNGMDILFTFIQML